MVDQVNVFDLFPAEAAEASDADTTAHEPSVKFAKSVPPSIASEREYSTVKTPLPAMNAPEVGLEIEIDGFCASPTAQEVTVSSL